jgi:hypothetical protein
MEQNAPCRVRKPSAASRWMTLAKATAGVECRKDADVIDETPKTYKSIAAVMEAQHDPVDVVAISPGGLREEMTRERVE